MLRHILSALVENCHLPSSSQGQLTQPCRAAPSSTALAYDSTYCALSRWKTDTFDGPFSEDSAHCTLVLLTPKIKIPSLFGPCSMMSPNPQLMIYLQSLYMQ